MSIIFSSTTQAVLVHMHIRIIVFSGWWFGIHVTGGFIVCNFYDLFWVQDKKELCPLIGCTCV